eukprot:scaffold3581_cov252-Pinguiococcus_pyrenoidosus.AAC.9
MGSTARAASRSLTFFVGVGAGADPPLGAEMLGTEMLGRETPGSFTSFRAPGLRIWNARPPKPRARAPAATVALGTSSSDKPISTSTFRVASAAFSYDANTGKEASSGETPR